jgi:transcriptional regulator with GAF, ATPase, and Fis domain
MEEMVHAVSRAMNERRLESENASYAQTVVSFKESVKKTQTEPSLVNEWSENEVTSSYTVLKKKWSEAFEKEYLTQVLTKHQGNVTAAAKEAAVDRSNFLRLLRRHQIDASAYRATKKAA